MKNYLNYILGLGFIAALSACDMSKLSDSVPTGFPNIKPGQNSAGGVDGGGGKSVVCRNAEGHITSAELLDLYEGSKMYGLNIQKSNAPFTEQIETALAVIPPSARSMMAAYAHIVRDKMTLLPLGTEIVPVDDSLEVVVPKNCQVEQLARFYSQDKILVNGEIWQSLDEANRAALILHEAVYAHNRLVGATDSRRSRHIIANLFDPATKWTDAKEDVPADALECIAMSGGLLHMWAYKDSSNSWILQFNILGKSFVASKKWARVFGHDEIDLNEAATFPVSRGTDEIGRFIKMSLTPHSDFEADDLMMLSKIWEAPTDSNGNPISGYQVPRYYLSWQSGSFPDHSKKDMLLNCSVKTYH